MELQQYLSDKAIAKLRKDADIDKRSIRSLLDEAFALLSMSGIFMDALQNRIAPQEGENTLITLHFYIDTCIACEKIDAALDQVFELRALADAVGEIHLLPHISNSEQIADRKEVNQCELQSHPSSE